MNGPRLREDQHLAAVAVLRRLGDRGQRDRQIRAYAETHQSQPGKEDPEVGGERLRERPDGDDCHRYDENLAAHVQVTQPATHQRTDCQAGCHDRGQQAHLVAGETDRLLIDHQSDAVDCQRSAIDERGESGNDRHPPGVLVSPHPRCGSDRRRIRSHSAGTTHLINLD